MADMDDKFDPSNPSHRSSLIFMADILDEHFLTKSFVQSVLVENEHEVHFPASENQHTYIDANIGFNVLSKEPTLSTDEKSSSRGTLSHRIARAGFSAPTINTGQINSANVASTLDNQPTYLTISPNNTPSAFVDSPVLLSNSLVQLSPTTGKFSLPLHGFSSLPISTLGSTIVENCKGECPDETMPGGIPFQPPSDTTALYCSSLEAKISFPTENIEKNIQNDFSGPCCIKDPVNDISENSSPPEAEYNGEDGYNWRKYGQKHVKGSEYPRGYYKCTHPNCPVKKKVERSHEGYITEIIYSRKHNHEIPVKKCRSGIPPFQLYYNKVDTSTMYGESSLVVFGDNSSSTLNQDVLNISSSNSVDELEDEETQASIGTEGDGVGDENESNRRNLDACGVEMNIGARAGRDSRIVVQTVSEIDVLDDGYKWRKYGQKVVKGNPNPRNYYKCTSAGCSVRKHVERASNDLASVITTYEGKHNHEVPAARNLIHHPAAAYPSQALIRRHPKQPQDVMSLNPPTVLNNFNLSSSNYGIRPLGLNNIEIGGVGQMGQVRFPVHDPNHYYSANIGADGVVLPEKMATEVYEQFMSTHHPLGPFEPHGP